MTNTNCVSRLILLAITVAVDVIAQTGDGHVVNSLNGADVPGASVNLVQAGEVAYSATADSHGHFHIQAVKPGLYNAHYRAPGFWAVPNFFLDEDFERECGHCFLAERGGQPFQVTSGGDPVSIEARMSPIGKISGRVLDNAGEPVPNASVRLHWGESWLCRLPSCIGISRQTMTNEKGEYSVTNLDVPGAWLFSAIAPSSWKSPESRDNRRLDRAQTFYPAVTDPQLAVRVPVGFGSDISNVDIRLAALPVHRVRGVVLDLRGDPVPKAAVALRKGIDSPALTRNTRNDGAFEFETVAEGEWRISAKGDQDGAQLWAAQRIQVKAQDLENLELHPAAPFAIRGRIVVEAPEGAPAPKPGGVILAFNGGAASFLTAFPNANGELQIRNIYLGPYQILPGPVPPQYYLDSIQIGGRDALGSEVEITSASQPLTVTYNFGGGTVRGAVENCAAGTVRLIPRDVALRRPGFVLFAACDSNDRYQVTAVRPGEYCVLAIAGDSHTAWYANMSDDDALVTNAHTVTARDGENSSADLRAIRQ